MERSEFAGSSAVSADDLRALVREITESVSAGVHASMAQQFAEFGGRMESLEASVEALRSDYGRKLETLADAVARAERRLSDIDSMMARYDKRLSSIETFPRLPINQPSRLYATQVQSVSHPKRVRVGYAG
ncbi:hypothetical protein HZ992_18930 [Rhizobacter sp. AJA081-3]|uniref:hypothetical protein n=1 Tax=Rhizobacter sp. AJA081-3 TaxID=2753607 RepID=UPI001ADFF5B7|nr:hypothetical protein [Rhizobacter sp. AJA081-3]QTN22215.1 hypothetical protein HZ992_18930 [Rhizobacter sp. AJA081-3]